MNLDPTAAEIAEQRRFLDEALADGKRDPYAFVLGAVESWLDVAAEPYEDRREARVRTARAVLAAFTQWRADEALRSLDRDSR